MITLINEYPDIFDFSINPTILYQLNNLNKLDLSLLSFSEAYHINKLQLTMIGKRRTNN
jgi:hypothetical protein